eukprot:CFRG3427T1
MLGFSDTSITDPLLARTLTLAHLTCDMSASMQCSVCNNIASRTCSCITRFFCSDECQDSDWVKGGHQNSCPVVTGTSPGLAISSPLRSKRSNSSTSSSGNRSPGATTMLTTAGPTALQEERGKGLGTKLLSLLGTKLSSLKYGTSVSVSSLSPTPTETPMSMDESMEDVRSLSVKTSARSSKRRNSHAVTDSDSRIGTLIYDKPSDGRFEVAFSQREKLTDSVDGIASRTKRSRRHASVRVRPAVPVDSSMHVSKANRSTRSTNVTVADSTPSALSSSISKRGEASSSSPTDLVGIDGTIIKLRRNEVVTSTSIGTIAASSAPVTHETGSHEIRSKRNIDSSTSASVALAEPKPNRDRLAASTTMSKLVLMAPVESDETMTVAEDSTMLDPILACSRTDCDKRFANKLEYDKHAKLHTDDRYFVCQWEGCPKCFNSHHSRLTHMRIHTCTKPFKCTWKGCGKYFDRNTKLIAHTRTHTGEKPFKCMWKGCGLQFAQGSHLQTHTRTHTGEKPYGCTWEGCDKFFARSSSMEHHLRTHTGERPFPCTWADCGKHFARMNSLVDHMRTHTGERPYRCSWHGCLKAFAQSSSLGTHLKTHTGEKPFICTWQICDKRFVDRSGLEHHLRTHTGERPYGCKVEGCGKRFAQSTNLGRHMKTHTND